VSSRDQHAREPWWTDGPPVRTDSGGGDGHARADELSRDGAVSGNGVPYADDMPFADSGAGAGALPLRNGGPGAGGAHDAHSGPGESDPPHRNGVRHDIADPPSPGPKRSRAQIFIPAPEDLPPPETVFGPARVPEPGRVPGPGRVPEPGRVPGPGRVPEPGRVPGPGRVPEPGRVPGPGRIPDPAPLGGVPDPPVLEPGPAGPGRGNDVARPGPSRPGGARRPAAAARPHRHPIDRRRLAVVYDVEGPRVRLGVAWFAGAMAATLASPFTAAVVFAAAAGLAARQVVRAWGSVPWQADLAAGLGAVPVLAALIGTPAVVVTVVIALAVAVGAGCAPDGARLPGGEGRVAAMGILAVSVVPAAAGATFVLVRTESVVAAAVLLLIASAYEVGDYIVGSGASNPVEGPLAGITTVTLVSLPLALVLVEPYDAAGVGLLAFAALACPLGQVVASAVLPGAAAPAPALRRIDTLLVLAPVWAAAAGAF
jgi:hypothetical protein